MIKYPVDLEKVKQRLLSEIVIPYPIFQAVVDSMMRRGDRFISYISKFESYIEKFKLFPNNGGRPR
jgi:hypothetical protein